MNDSDRKQCLLRLEEIAQMLSLSKHLAREFLREKQISPVIDFGRGRGRGPRWSAEEIEAVIKRAKTEAKPKPRKPLHLAQMSIEELYKLVNS